ncbi:dihydrolipoamide acetyltransferase family protein [Salinicoccus halitifaciens]|uniref:Dihydrolipoamide acetyltransferase component of pyruvate dehydrogenase complex n=1 Tax=Salinicoccus halitifaciens TaxID=1073415 RepID=A0ABV2EDF9_9STAP|nr:dihydrolipoamide acetyltransferase family protein [Salinicoccus halitifaciens]MCD2138754.1 2-oxo acid dehydrogenase subunit E2 [Salinicoccus halitifaciens]
MTLEITLPRQSEKLDESLITFWHVSEGDAVEKGETIVEVQTEKAVTEVHAPESGTINKINKNRGDTVKVGEVLAVLDEGGQQSESNEADSGGEEKEASKQQSKPVTENRATPRVKKIARELDVDWKEVTPSRDDGKVTEEDIRRFAEESGSSETAHDTKEEEETKHQVSTEAEDGIRRIPLTGIRKMVANTMTHSKSSIPHVTHFDEANVSKLVELREILKKDFDSEGVKLTYMSFVIKAFTNVLREYPYLNASFDEKNEEIILKNQYHIGFAADTDEGLLVPVIKDTDQQSLFKVAKKVQELAKKARNGSITLEDMTDGTATISNVGSAQGSFFTPIINPPQSSILGIGRIEKKVIATDDDEIEIQPRMALSLSYDHRVIDGVMAQEAMNELKRLLEEPGKLLAY